METDDILAIFLDRGGHTIFGVYFYRMLYRRKQECLIFDIRVTLRKPSSEAL